VGTGFDEAILRRLQERLAPLETKRCPFSSRPATNERPHWVEPTVGVEVRFTARTEAGLLRQPVFVGLKEDAAPGPRASPASRPIVTAPRPNKQTEPPPVLAGLPRPFAEVEEELAALERAGRNGRLTLPDGTIVPVSNLRKVYWPAAGLTKGALLRYYVRVAPFLLPVIEDRPLVMRRFPEGVDGDAFYQQRAPEKVPAGVRVERVPDDPIVDEGEPGRPGLVDARLVGGGLATLLHMAQLGVISQDPWFSRVQSSHAVDHVALDLDPMPDVPFARVLDCARWIREELERYQLPGYPKTSGATGIHVFIPLAPDTPYEAGRLFSQILATIIARKHPKVATVERVVDARGRTVYVDYLQNIRGKTLACAYSARASAFAGASTPVTWEEIEAGLRPEDFTIATLPARLESTGDLWAGVRQRPRVDLHAALDRLARALPALPASPGPTRVGGRRRDRR
jgi:bifunctional non-homologous end joining protein LigD